MSSTVLIDAIGVSVDGAVPLWKSREREKVEGDAAVGCEMSIIGFESSKIEIVSVDSAVDVE